MIKTTLKIDGMMCGMCESHVNDAVRNAIEVKKVSSSHKKGTTEILTEQPVDEEKVKAAIENMTLTATELGLGSLWICDTFFAQKELSEWLNGELYAALAVGYAEEKTCARPRKKPENTIEWRL